MQRWKSVQPENASGPAEEPTRIRVEDPVCGMPIDPSEAAGSASAGEHTVYFCSNHCRRIFANDPGRYAEGSS